MEHLPDQVGITGQGLIGKGGEILAIAPGCDTSGLLAKKLSERIAKTVDAPAVDVRAKVNEKK